MYVIDLLFPLFSSFKIRFTKVHLNRATKGLILRKASLLVPEHLKCSLCNNISFTRKICFQILETSWVENYLCRAIVEIKKWLIVARCCVLSCKWKSLLLKSRFWNTRVKNFAGLMSDFIQTPLWLNFKISDNLHQTGNTAPLKFKFSLGAFQKGSFSTFYNHIHTKNKEITVFSLGFCQPHLEK